MPKNTIIYTEPVDFFPKEIREKYKLGEFAETDDTTENPETEKKEAEPKPAKKKKTKINKN